MTRRGALAAAQGAVINIEEHPARVVAVQAQRHLGPLQSGARAAAQDEALYFAHACTEEERILALGHRQPRSPIGQQAAELRVPSALHREQRPVEKAAGGVCLYARATLCMQGDCRTARSPLASVMRTHACSALRTVVSAPLGPLN